MSFTFIHPQALWLLLLLPITAGVALYGSRRPTQCRFWGGLAVRILLLLLIILAISGIQVRLPEDNLTVVFVLDLSDSVSAEQQVYGESIIREAVQNMPDGDQAAIVVFGEDALVEQLATETTNLSSISSIPITNHTDIASALQLALALFPDVGAKRLVLLSDGRENIGHAIDQAELAAAHNIELTFVPLGDSYAEIEVLLASLNAPASVRRGQVFNITPEIFSTASTTADLRISSDDGLIQSLNIILVPGNNRFPISIEADKSGFQRFTAQIIPENDTLLQNNQASAFTVVHGPPRVLIIEGFNENSPTNQGSGSSFSDALSSANMHVTTIAARETPTNLTALADYDAVILVDVSATSLPVESMEILEIYVRDLGRGLIMTGGEKSFGAGGYLRTPIEKVLPVYMDVRNKEQEANLALVLAVDKSGSMGRCHCDDPDLNQTYSRQESGQPKVDIAKEAIMRAAGALGNQDFLGVVAFDTAAKWAFEIQKLVNPYSLENAIGRIPAQGQTDLNSGVEAAYESLEDVQAQRKHIILLTDGWVHQTALLNKASQMKEDGITLSVVAAGGGSAQYLEELAQKGGGTYYPAADILNVPDFFLKETVTAVGRYIIEEPFYPLPGMSSPILTNLDISILPPLYGYNGTTPKGTARIDLITPQGDPLLATWQYGLGRAAAWTSDVESHWATPWLTWEEFPQFAAQLVGWTLPAPRSEGLLANAHIEENRGVIELEAIDPSGLPLNFLYVHASIIGPDLSISETELSQVGPGRYQAEIALSKPGTYLVRMGVNDGDTSLGGEIIGLVFPYSAEYRDSGTDMPFLRNLAGITGGEELTEPVTAFIHNLEISENSKEIWQPLLLVVALLFPLDIAIRRLMFNHSDYNKVLEWIKIRLPLKKNDQESPDSRIQGLFSARDRVRWRQLRDTNEKASQRKAENNIDRDGNNQKLPGRDNSFSDYQYPGEEESKVNTISRLKDAKNRAKRKD